MHAIETIDTTNERRQAVAKPYPAWTELIDRLRHDGTDARAFTTPAAGERDWHTLVADMIAGR